MLTKLKETTTAIQEIRSQLKVNQEKQKLHHAYFYHRCLEWILAQSLVEVALEQGVGGLSNYSYKRWGDIDPHHQSTTYNRWVEAYIESPEEMGPDPRKMSPPFCNHVMKIGNYGNATRFQEADDKEKEILHNFQTRVKALLTHGSLIS